MRYIAKINNYQDLYNNFADGVVRGVLQDIEDLGQEQEFFKHLKQEFNKLYNDSTPSYEQLYSTIYCSGLDWIEKHKK